MIYIEVKLSAIEALKKGLNSVRNAINKKKKIILEEILVTTRKTQQALADKREKSKFI
jgi:SpoVK/Ycf46/Vps4 family AAA+-type ATPase